MKALECYKKVESKSLPHIKSFQKDLLCWDKKAMLLSPETPFLHFTREYGTHIVFFENADKYPAGGETVKYLFGYADKYHILKGVIKTVEHVTKQETTELILYFNGNTIKEIDGNTAMQLALDYYNKTRNQFN